MAVNKKRAGMTFRLFSYLPNKITTNLVVIIERQYEPDQSARDR